MTMPVAGLTDVDARTHMVLRQPGGEVAACRIGPIVRRLPGFFDAGDPLACVKCAEAATLVDGKED